MENNARIIKNIQNTLKMVREQLDSENAVPKKVKYTSLLIDDIGQRLDIGAENASLISEPKVIEMKRKMGFI